MPLFAHNSPQIGDEVNFSVSQQPLLSRITNRMSRSLELSEILCATVVEVQAFLGTDRVKIYQFQPDYHGLVIAEALGGDRLPALKDLHFPADDIPAHARERYLRLRIRTIVDLDSQTIGISPIDSPANLTYHEIDPCHVEYLRAMGIKSSVVVPIAIEATPNNPNLLSSVQPEEHLWGLLVSHHASQREVTAAELCLLQSVVDRLSVAITQSMLLQRVREQAKQEAALNRVTTLLHATSTVDLQAALAETVAVFQGVGGRLYLPEHSNSDLPIQNSKQYAYLYTCGTQPDYKDHLAEQGRLRERYIEENLIWQKYLLSVATPLKTEDGDSDAKPWSVEWMRSIYALTGFPAEPFDKQPLYIDDTLSRRLISGTRIDSNIWALLIFIENPYFGHSHPLLELLISEDY
jgi:GAF domain-containing protein